MILVTGATGSVGGALLAQLVDADLPVRAMTRRPAALSVPPGVEVVAGDGSVLGGGAGDDVIARWHAEAEHAVTASGLEWTLLRPGRFHTNALRWAPVLHRGDTVHLPFAHRAAAGIDPADVAAVAALALSTDDLIGDAPYLTGPESLTPTEEVAVLAGVLGRDLEVVEVGDEQAREGMLSSGMSAEAVDAAVARTHGTHGSDVLTTVADVLGRAPRPFVAWALEHAPAFRRDDD